MSAAVNTLDKIMLFGFLVILVFSESHCLELVVDADGGGISIVSLPIFGVSISSSFSSIYTIFIAASFIFKNAASNAFDSIMFLFVTQ